MTSMAKKPAAKGAPNKVEIAAAIKIFDTTTDSRVQFATAALTSFLSDNLIKQATLHQQ